MRRHYLVFALVAAVLLAALGLTYYSYRNTPSERLVVLDTMRELAGEKVIGIQTEIIKAQSDMFARVDPAALVDLQKALKESPLRSVLVVDRTGKVQESDVLRRVLLRTLDGEALSTSDLIAKAKERLPDVFTHRVLASILGMSPGNITHILKKRKEA